MGHVLAFRRFLYGAFHVGEFLSQLGDLVLVLRLGILSVRNR